MGDFISDTIYDEILHSEVITEGISYTLAKLLKYMRKHGINIKDKNNPIQIMVMDLTNIERKMVRATTIQELDNLNSTLRERINI